MKNVAILGSTGSIGKNALSVIRHFPDKFRVVALSTNSNIEILQAQIREFDPLFIGVADASAAKRLRKPSGRPKLFIGEEGLEELVQQGRIDKVLFAISGGSALWPLLRAIESGKEVALANKEALVMAGPIIMNEANKRKIKIIPIDSEQSAIWQCLSGQDMSKLSNIYLTASGGPFRQLSRKELKGVSIERVLKHPRWKMGRKISVDSANLMNKGLELLEAMFLFNVPSDKIKILVHPQALVHSMVEFTDGVVLAQLSATDMRIPIQYALTYPERLGNSFGQIDFYKLKELDFEKPDFKKHPCIKLAYRVAKELGTSCAVLNAANEISVNGFLRKRISFVAIPEIIEKVLNKHRNNKKPGLVDIMEADIWARREAQKVIERLN